MGTEGKLCAYVHMLLHVQPPFFPFCNPFFPLLLPVSLPLIPFILVTPIRHIPLTLALCTLSSPSHVTSLSGSHDLPLTRDTVRHSGFQRIQSSGDLLNDTTADTENQSGSSGQDGQFVTPDGTSSEKEKPKIETLSNNNNGSPNHSSSPLLTGTASETSRSGLYLMDIVNPRTGLSRSQSARTLQPRQITASRKNLLVPASPARQ